MLILKFYLKNSFTRELVSTKK